LIGTVLFKFIRDDKEWSIDLKPGDCIIMTGESRFNWKHGFERVEQERIGITMRKMKLNKDGICI
jgi:alkylated DNA repair dioxygenase AlkB